MSIYSQNYIKNCLINGFENVHKFIKSFVNGKISLIAFGILFAIPPLAGAFVAYFFLEKLCEKERLLVKKTRDFALKTLHLKTCQNLLELNETEKILEDFPRISCSRREGKPIFKLQTDLGNLSIKLVCDKEAFVKQSEYLQKLLENEPGKESLLLEKVNPVVFNYLRHFLQNNKKQCFTDSSEYNLLDLYKLSFYLGIPHLSALCVKEIIQRLNKDEWQNIELLVPYRNDLGLLGTIFLKDEVLQVS